MHMTWVMFVLGVLAVGVVNARGATVVAGVYAQQPAWWNAVALVTPTARVERADVYWNWLQATNPPAGNPVGDWHVIGPFDGVKGAAIDKPYPPEKAIELTTIQGAGSRPVSWQSWPEGTPCPLTNTIPDTIAYAARKIAVNAPSSGGLTVFSRAGYRLWVDGRPVVTNGAAGNGQYVPLELDTGAHTILVKAYLPDGAWGWSATWAAADPRFTEIKSRSMVVTLWPRDETVLRGHAPRLAALYLDLEDTVNAGYWVGITLDACRTNTPEASAAIGSWVATASRSAVAGPALMRELGQVLGRLPRQDPLRPFLADAVYNLGLALARPDETALLWRAAGVRPTPDQSVAMTRVCLASNRMDNALFWIEPYLTDFPNAPAGYGNFAATVADWLQRSPDPFRPALYESIDRAVTAGTNADLRAILADGYMKDVLARKDTDRASQFLKVHAATLAIKRSFEAAIWRLQTAVLKNDETAARAALDAAVLARPAFTNSPEFTQYRVNLFKFNSTAAMPSSVELTPDEALASADRLAKAGNTRRLGLYLRDVLRSRGDSTVPVAGDTGLFIGAKPYYRKTLAAHAPVYETWLRKEVEDLTAHPLRQDEARRLDRIAHFAPPVAATGNGVAAGSEAAAGAPISAARFVPLLDLSPGLPEVIEDELRYQVKATPTPAAILTVRGGDTWLANSRLLACLRGGEVVWSWAAPLSCLPLQIENCEFLSHFLLGGRCEPAVAGEIVATRVLLPDATPALVGLDRRTGAYRWTWRPGKGILAGAPTSWGTNRLVVMTATADGPIAGLLGYRNDLVVLDARGVELATVQLGGRRVHSGKNVRLVGDRKFDPDSYWQAPRPVVAGDIAYVSTAMGLVGAVNLADESILWLRTYLHNFDDSVTGFRVARPPVMGATTVLFAPQDSNRLMLLDKATGRLVASRTDLAWTEVAPCGPEAAVVLTRSAGYLMSLADLGERRLPADRSFTILQPVREGCLLAEPNGAVTLCGPDGKLTPMAPASENVRLLGRGPDGVCYGAGGPGGQWCGVVDPAGVGTAPLFIRPQRNVASLCDMDLGVLAATNGAVSLAANGLILMGVGADGRRLWELPALPGNGLVSDKGRVVTARAGRVWAYDERTGDLLKTWPAGFGVTGAVQRVLSAPLGGTYVMGFDSDQRMTLWSLDTERDSIGPKVAQWAPNSIGSALNAAMIQTSTQVVVAIKHARVYGWTALWTAPRGVTNAVFERKNDKQAYASLWSSGMDWYSRAIRFSAAAATQTQAVIRVDQGGPREFQIQVAPGKAPGHIWRADQLLLLLRDDQTVTAVNPATGSALDLAGANVSAPAVVGSRIYGVKATMTGEVAAAKVENYRPYTCAMDGINEPVLGPPLPSGFIVNNFLSAIVQSGGEATLIASPGWALSWRGAVAQDPCRLPAIPDWGWGMPFRVWSTPQGVVNVGGVWMSPPQWQSVLHLSNTVHMGMETSRVVNVDGFLDEWPANEFFDIPLGRMAANVRRVDVRPNALGELVLAVDIQDAATVERLGVEGLDDRLTITAVRSSSLGFVEPPPPSVRPTMKSFRPATINGQNIEFAWTVTPDGRRCRIEATVSGIPFDSNNKEEARDWGNVAVRLLWRRNVFEEPVNLVATGGWGPLSYTRVKFWP